MKNRPLRPMKRNEIAFENWREAVKPYVYAQHMVREAIGELFGPIASLEGPDAVLLRGPEPQHEAEAVIEALKRVADHSNALADAYTAQGKELAKALEDANNYKQAMLSYYQELIELRSVKAELAAMGDIAANQSIKNQALKTAIEHIEHMAAWIGKRQSPVYTYSFESLGEDIEGLKQARDL